MRWPRLVPPAVCCTPCTVVLTGAEGEDGAPQVLTELSLACNWQDKPRQELDAERRLITLSGTDCLTATLRRILTFLPER